MSVLEQLREIQLQELQSAACSKQLAAVQRLMLGLLASFDHELEQERRSFLENEQVVVTRSRGNSLSGDFVAGH